MFSKNVINQIDEYLELCENFNLGEYENFCREIVALAEQEYDNNISSRIANKIAEMGENASDELLNLEYGFKEVTDVLENKNIINDFLEKISPESKKAYKRIYCSEINAANLGEFEEFVDLQRTLVLIAVSPFPSKDIEFLKLPNTYSVPCQKIFEAIAVWSCYGITEKNTVYNYITLDSFAYNNAFKEIVKISGEIKNTCQSYIEQINGIKKQNNLTASENADPLIDEVAKCLIKAGQASTSLLQRKFKVGYAHAARLIDDLEELGVVSSYNGSKPRKILISENEYLQLFNHSTSNSIDEFKTGLAFLPRELFIAYCLYKISFWMISNELLIEAKEIIELDEDINLPKLAMKLIKSNYGNEGNLDAIKKFKREYEVTSEEIMVINQRYYLEQEAKERDWERKEKEDDALARCKNCIYGDRCNTFGSISCNSYIPKY